MSRWLRNRLFRRPRLAVETLENRVNPSATLDAAFGNSLGIIRSDLSSGNDFWSAVALQPDGKIVAAGRGISGGFADFCVARFNADGSYDSTFSSDGKFQIALSATGDEATAVSIQPDGRIVAAGYSNNGTNDDYALIRLTADGSLDTSFSGDGKITVAMGSGADRAKAVAIQADGAILAAGSTDSSSGDFGILRLTATGAFDNSFSGDGKQTVDFGGNDAVNAIAIQPDGKILLAGNTFSGVSDFTAARLLTNGNLDPLFDGDGKLVLSLSVGTDSANAIALYPDGRILLAGVGSNNNFAVARFTTAGAPDLTFDGDGMKLFSLNGANEACNAAALQSDGRIVLAGVTNPGNLDTVAIRLTDSGALDASFDGDGYSVVAVSDVAGTDFASGLAIQTDGHILLAGSADNTTGGNDETALVRLNPDGSRDLGFGAVGDGRVRTPIENDATISYYFSASAVQSDGKVVSVGTQSDNVGNFFVIVRHNRDGSIDTTFSSNGYVGGFVIGVSPYQETAHGLTILANGDIVVVGEAWNGTSMDFAVAVLNSDGSLDNGFSGDGRLLVPVSTKHDIAYAVETAADGDLFVVGESKLGSVADWAVARINSNGTLDTALNATGYKTYDFGSVSERASCLGIQSDGKIVVGGFVGGTSVVDDFLSIRISAVGAYDTTYSGDGIAQFAYGTEDFSMSDLAIQSDGKLLFAGYTNNAGEVDAVAFRLTTAGVLDSTFDGDGRRTISFAASDFDTARRIAVQRDGRIVVAGSISVAGTAQPAVTRLNADGSLETTFAGDGMLTIPCGDGYTEVHGLALQDDGVIVVTGDRYTGSNPDGEIIALRLNRYGQAVPLDVASPGRAELDLAGNNEWNAVAVMPDGRFVVAGYDVTGTGEDFAVARYLPDGALDPTFGTNGVATVSFSTTNDRALGVAVDSNNRVVVVGQTLNSVTFQLDFAVARFTAAGILDNGFDTDGKLVISQGTQDFANAVAIQSDNKIVIAGYADGQNALVRLTTTGGYDNAFDTDGKRLYYLGTSGGENPRALAIQSDGKILFAGTAGTSANGDFAVARVNSDGSFDNTFDGDGKAPIAIGSGHDLGTGMALQADGRIVLCGTTNVGTNTDFALVRLTASGGLDATFDADGKTSFPAFLSGSDNDTPQGVAVLADGRIAVVGYTATATGEQGVAAVLTSLGALDGDFAGGGRIRFPIGLDDDRLNAVAVQGGRFVAAGSSEIGTEWDGAVARFNAGPNGTVSVAESLGSLLVTSNQTANALTVRGGNGEVSLADTTGSDFLVTASPFEALVGPWFAVLPTAGYTDLTLSSGSGDDAVGLDLAGDWAAFPNGLVLAAGSGADLLAIRDAAANQFRLDAATADNSSANGSEGIATVDAGAALSLAYSGIERVAFAAAQAAVAIAGGGFSDSHSLRQSGAYEALLAANGLMPHVAVSTALPVVLTLDGAGGNDAIVVDPIRASIFSRIDLFGGAGTDTATIGTGATVAANGDTSIAFTIYGTLSLIANSSVDSLAGTGTVALNGLTLTVGTNGGTAQFDGAIAGPGSLIKTGFGIQTLTGPNSATALTIQQGYISTNNDAALAAAGVPITVGVFGTLHYYASTATTRMLDLGLGTLLVNNGASLTLNGNAVGGGFLTGPGTLATSGTVNFVGNQAVATININALTNASFTNFTNNGTLTGASGKTHTLSNFHNGPAGQLFLNGTTNATAFSTQGKMTVGGPFTNSNSAMVFGGGSLTTIGNGGTLDTGLDANALITNAYVKNNGAFGNASKTIVVDFGGFLEGNAAFGSVIEQNGGIYAPGNSPGPASTNQFNVNGGGRLEFEITNATGSAATLSGWDCITVQPTVFGATGVMAFTATPASKYTILLASRENSGDFNTAGDIANFASSGFYAWKFADASGQYSTTSGTFDASAFAIDTSDFSNVFNGAFTVELRDGGKNLYVVYTPLAGPFVTSISVNHGDGQRSRITSIDVVFANPVTVGDFNSIPISLTRYAVAPTSTGAVTQVVQTGATGSNGLITISQAVPGSNTITLAFSVADGSTQVIDALDYGSLSDGYWQLVIGVNGSIYQSPGNENTLPPTESKLRRLFGDQNNDGFTDSNDYGFLGASFGLSTADAAFDASFDFNADGFVDSNDLGFFGSRFGLGL